MVTGASSGIGRATTLRLAGAGVTVLAVARREAELRETAAAVSGRIEPVVADVTTPAGRDRVRAAAGSEPLDFLVHGAGVFPRRSLVNLSPGEWDAAMETNVSARLHLVRDLLPVLRGGRVMFIGSDAAHVPRRGGAAYSVSKAASLMLWRCLREELGEEIAFAMVKPGLVATEMLTGSLAAPRDEFPAGAVYAEMLARGETIHPDTVARFLCHLLLEVDRAEFAGDVWDIRDASHHARWLEGSLWSPAGASG